MTAAQQHPAHVNADCMVTASRAPAGAVEVGRKEGRKGRMLTRCGYVHFIPANQLPHSLSVSLSLPRPSTFFTTAARRPQLDSTRLRRPPLSFLGL